MSRKINTLNELNQYLENNTDVEVLSSTEDFLKREAVTLSKVDFFNEQKEEQKVEEKNEFTSSELADYVHSRAKKENKSFMEVWLEVLEEGSKKDMLIPFDKAFRTWTESIPNRSWSIVKESLNTVFKEKA